MPAVAVNHMVNLPGADPPDHPDVQSAGHTRVRAKAGGTVSVIDLLNRRRQRAARGGVEVLRSEVIGVRQRFDGRVDFHAQRVSVPPEAQQADTVDARDATDRGGGPSRSVRR